MTNMNTFYLLYLPLPTTALLPRFFPQSSATTNKTLITNKGTPRPTVRPTLAGGNASCGSKIQKYHSNNHTFISKLLPLVIVGVVTIVVCKVSVISKIGNNKMHDHDNRNIKAKGISLL